MKHLFTLICDDIRSELGNKISIIGIYDEAILPHSIPGRMPKLCLYQLWEAERDIFKEAERMRIELRGSALASGYSVEAIANQEATLPAAQVGHEPEASRKRGRLLLTFSPVEIISEGELEFATYIKNAQEPEHVQKLSIRRPSPSPTPKAN
jgi:hypothetical protein